MESTPTERSAAPEQRVLVGRYQIGELIGRGGMAEVHAGWDTRLGREVAIKVLRSDLARDGSFLQRFRREAQSAAGLNHPGIVAVYDSGEDTTIELGGAPLAVPFIVMELVHGKTLREMLHARGGPLAPTEACRVMAAMLRALAYSHANGLIHRDIKPANIMVTDGGEVKLTDFGIARAVADSAATLTNTAVVVGTAQYLSPEQAQGQLIDARADVYAAGCVLYELLTGRPPFTGDSPLAIAYQHVGQQPQPPSTHAPDIPPDLDGVTLHALAKEPGDRYASAGEFAADLEAVHRGSRPSEAALAAAPAAAGTGAAATEGGSAGPDGAGGARGAGPARAGGLDGPPASRDSDTSALPAVPPPVDRRRRRVLGALGALTLALVTLLGVLAAQGRLGDTAEVTVPDVRTKTIQAAQDQLRALGLGVDVRPVANSAAQGVVVRQTPDGGQQAPASSQVRLEVSTGPGSVTLPNLYNYDQATARSILLDSGLVVQFAQVDNAEVGAGRVVATDPKAGSGVKEGGTVKLLVSNGKVKVPDLRGKTESEARQALMRLTFRFTPSYVDSGGAPGTVIEMDFVGQSVPQGSEIRATVVREVPRPIPTETRTATVTVTQSASPPPSTPPVTPTASATTTPPAG